MAFVDHYRVLGLPTGEEGTRLSEKQIASAFKAKALKVHPDKRPVGEAATAHEDFHKLNQSYEILMDVHQRRRFDAVILARIRLQQRQCRTRFTRYDDSDSSGYDDSEADSDSSEEKAEIVVPRADNNFIREVCFTFGVSLACSLAVALAFGLAATKASVSVKMR